MQNKTRKRKLALSQNKVAMKKYYLIGEKKKMLLCLHEVSKVGSPYVGSKREGEKGPLYVSI